MTFHPHTSGERIWGDKCDCGCSAKGPSKCLLRVGVRDAGGDEGKERAACVRGDEQRKMSVRRMVVEVQRKMWVVRCDWNDPRVTRTSGYPDR